MMKFRQVVCSLGLLGLLTLSGCKDMKARACLDEVKLRFNDPDSVQLVKVLGDRGWSDVESGRIYWIRYKATNKFGAWVSSNMACAKDPNTDRRLVDLSEETALLMVKNSLRKEALDRLKSGYPADADVDERAHVMVYEDFGDLPRPLAEESPKPVTCRGSGAVC